MNGLDVIIKPIITEQSMKAVTGGKYSFVVARFADKTAIKNAVNKQFGVTVLAVATSIIKGRSKRVGAKRQEISLSLWKKAVVTIKKGETIAMFEPGGGETK